MKRESEFTARASRELTDSICAKSIKAAREPLFKNWQGAMVGDGLLWFSECQRQEDKSWKHGIFTMGHFVFQQKDAVRPIAAEDE
jgi:hypothetical protein